MNKPVPVTGKETCCASKQFRNFSTPLLFSYFPKSFSLDSSVFNDHRFPHEQTFTMADHVVTSWNKVKEIPNYEIVAGEIMFRR
jgi:hypothetical protein